MKLILLLILFSISIYSQNFEIQTIDLKKEFTDLNSPKSKIHTWWATSQEINPKANSNDPLSKTNSFDLPDKIWVSTHIPGNPVAENIVNENSKYFWYRKVFILKEIPEEDQVLYIQRISDSDETYLNGTLIGRTGDWESDKAQAYDKARIYSINKELFRKDTPNILLIHVRKYFKESAGIWGEQNLIGKNKPILREYYLSNIKPLIFLFCYFSVGSYFIFLFLRRRKERENLYFGLFTLGFVAYHALRNQLRFEFGFTYFEMKKVEFQILILLLVFLYLFFRYYFISTENQFLRRLHYLNSIPLLSLVGLFIYMIFTTDIDQWNSLLNAYVIPFLWTPLLISIFLIITYNAFFKGNNDAKIMFAGWSMLISSIVFDILIHLGFFQMERFTEYGFFVFILSLAFILSNRFVRVHNEVEDLNQNLEKKVILRTEELQKALTRVNELKLSQDGDYFLTYLLLEPLTVKAISSPNINIDFLIRQKKKFSFHNENMEIGGDTCIAHTISLQNKSMTLFLNADAMGKSMQGAGGILVLNSIFESIVKRTNMNPFFANQTPENWLINAFNELHNVFIMFDGSMMISLNMGIIEDKTGRLCYINAEHPAIVLYRDEKANFLPLDETITKVGSPLLEETVSLNYYQLQDHDVLIIGSDGRDDLLLPNGDINDNFDIFSTHVEKGKGNLELILKEIEKIGEIYDDLSLMRIEYRKGETS